MTIPGAGGQVPPRVDQLVQQAQPVPVSPGGTPVTRVTEVIVTPGGVLQGIFTYSSNPPAAGTLIETASVVAAGTDQFGNHFLAGHASYGAPFAANLGGGFITLYTGSLAAGWTATATIETDVGGDLLLATSGAGSIQLAANVVLSGTFTDLGGNNTGSGNNGGNTGGPSGTVNAFPAAGPNHTHPEIHQHPL